MPCDYSKYPKNWKTEIRPRILGRARNHCEQCGVRDQSHVRRMVDNTAVYRYWSESDNVFLDSDRRLTAFYDQQLWHPAVKIVLTIAHIDQNVENSHDANLAAWCQRCHLMFDQRARALVVKALVLVEETRAGLAHPYEKIAEKYAETGYKAAKKKKGRPKVDPRPEDLNVVESIVGKKKGRPRKGKAVNDESGKDLQSVPEVRES